MLLRTLSDLNMWRSKVLSKIGCPDSVASGNAMSELQTKGAKHALSVWETPSTSIADIKDILVASAVTRDCLQGITYAVVDNKEVSDMGISELTVQGKSKPIIDNAILYRHRDLINLDFWKLGFLAESIMKFVNNHDDNSITKEALKTYIQEYIDAGKVDYNLLKDGMKPHFTPKQS